jgi:hypothetical protein
MSAHECQVPEVATAWAVRGGVLVHISEVDRGGHCQCHCSACGEGLYAKKGEQRMHHFAHATPSGCPGAAETLLHRLAKELLSTAPSIALPAYSFRRTYRSAGRQLPYEQPLLSACRLRLDLVQIEKPVGQIIPDLTAHIGPHRLLLEIVVTHPADRAKLRQVRRLDVPLVEIRLAPSDLMLAREALRERLVSDEDNKRWLFHPVQRAAEAEWIRRRRQASSAARTLKQELLDPVALRQGLRLGRAGLRRDDTQRWAAGFLRRHGRHPTSEEVAQHRRTVSPGSKGPSP